MGVCAIAASHQIYSGGVGCACRSGAFDKSTDEQSRASRGSPANRTSMLILDPETTNMKLVARWGEIRVSPSETATLLNDQLPHAMVRAVADVDVAPGIDEDAVRALQPAASGADLGAVSGSAVAHERLDRSTARADHANGMVLGVGNVEVAPRPDGDSLGARKRRHLCRSTVSG